MTDISIQIFLILILIFSNWVSLKRTKHFFNPITVISLTFFLPLFFSLFKLSDLQASNWNEKTYWIIIEAIVCWLILPAFLILFRNKEHSLISINLDLIRNHKLVFMIIARISAFITISAYLISNYVQTGLIFPIMVPELANSFHTSFPAGLQIFARSIPLSGCLVFVSYYLFKRKIDLFLILFLILTPLTKLARFDVFMIIFSLLVVNSFLPVIKFQFKRKPWRLFLIITVLAISIISLAYLGNQRLNRFGKYDLSYSEIIKFNTNPGPSDSLALLYGYFSLTFENVDRYISSNEFTRYDGKESFDWLLRGFLKLHWLDPSYTNQIDFTDTFVPVSDGAITTPVLVPFYADFGLGAFVPMVFYILLWMVFYFKAKSSLTIFIGYSLMSSSFALSSFDTPITTQILYQQILLTYFIVLAIKILVPLIYKRRNNIIRISYIKNK